MSPVPETKRLREWIADHASGQIDHPGLLQDRFLLFPGQSIGEYKQETTQLPQLNRIVSASGAMKSVGILESAWASRRDWINALRNRYTGGAQAAMIREWEASTVWRLAIHLSRPSPLENAALCLHPIHGFPVLPGTGLKGLARAWATLNDVPGADRERIFGPEQKPLRSGSVIFHDAWPANSWPEIRIDIVNNHHPDYYSTRGEESPGDWEDPNPVYFLTLAPGSKFHFLLSLSSPCLPVGSDSERDARSMHDLDLALSYLKRGLNELGAGAKTAAGYGYFDADSAEISSDAAVESPADKGAGTA